MVVMMHLQVVFPYMILRVLLKLGSFEILMALYWRCRQRPVALMGIDINAPQVFLPSAGVKGRKYVKCPFLSTQGGWGVKIG